MGARTQKKWWGAQKFALFLLSPTRNFIRSSLSGRCRQLSGSIGGGWNGTIWEANVPDRAGGASHETTRELQTRTFERPGASNIACFRNSKRAH